MTDSHTPVGSTTAAVVMKKKYCQKLGAHPNFAQRPSRGASHLRPAFVHQRGPGVPGSNHRFFSRGIPHDHESHRGTSVQLRTRATSTRNGYRAQSCECIRVSGYNRSRIMRHNSNRRRFQFSQTPPPQVPTPSVLPAACQRGVLAGCSTEYCCPCIFCYLRSGPSARSWRPRQSMMRRCSHWTLTTTRH